MRSKDYPGLRSPGNFSISLLVFSGALVLSGGWAGFTMAADSRSPGGPGQTNTVNQEQAIPPSTASLEGRRSAGYQVFASHLVLPPISLSGSNTMVVGGGLRIELGQAFRVSGFPTTELGQAFGVPVAVFERFQPRFSASTSLEAATLADEIRATVRDYKYLEHFWTLYRPPASGKETRDQALLALRIGDINKAWNMFNALPKPTAPSNLRIVVQQER